MAKKKKELTLGIIQKEDQKWNEKKEVWVNGYVVYIDKKFRPSKIQKLVLEFVDKVYYWLENNIDISNIDMQIYGLLLILRHFSSLDIPSEFDKQLQALSLLIDNDYFVPIVREFDPEEIKRVILTINYALERYEELTKALNNNFNIEELIQEAVEKAEEAENADVQKREGTA